MGPDLTKHLSRTQRLDQATCYSGIIGLNDLICLRRNTLLSIYSNTIQNVQSNHTDDGTSLPPGRCRVKWSSDFGHVQRSSVSVVVFCKDLPRRLRNRINTRCWHRSENRGSAETIRSTKSLFLSTDTDSRIRRPERMMT